MLAVNAIKRLRDIILQVDLTFGVGVTALVGPSGAGKSTLLRLIAGLVRPDEGTITLGRATLDDCARQYHVSPGKRDISLVFQEYALFPHLSVAENVGYGLRARRVGSGERHRRVSAMLNRLGIASLAGERPARLSGGQRQRVALARALVLQPRALLLDEPLAALDVQTRAAVRNELRAFFADLAIPVLLVTHDYADALAFRERIVIMDGGRVIQDGPHTALLSHPRSRFVADFTGVNYYQGVVDTGGALDESAVRVQVQDSDIAIHAVATAPVTGPVSVTVRPWDVVLATERPSSSARNVLPGLVRDVLPLGGRVRVTLAVGPRHATALVAEITPDAVESLDCHEGQTLYASFKATAVTVNAL